MELSYNEVKNEGKQRIRISRRMRRQRRNSFRSRCFPTNRLAQGSLRTIANQMRNAHGDKEGRTEGMCERDE